MATLPPESDLYQPIFARLTSGARPWPLLATLAAEYGLLPSTWQIAGAPTLDDVAKLLRALAGVDHVKAQARYKKLAAAGPATIAADFGAYLHDAVKWRQSCSPSGPSSSSNPVPVFARATS